MKDLRSQLAKTIDLCSPGDGLHPAPVPGAYCVKVSQPHPARKNHWRASLAIVAQGCKEIVLGRDLYRIEDGRYTAAPVDLPVISRVICASREKPFLCLLVHMDPLTLGEVAAQLEKDFPKDTEDRSRAVFVGKASDKMLDAAVRLGKLFRNPEDAPVLAPLVIKEMLYHLVKGANGAAIVQFVRSGSTIHKIAQAIHRLRADLSNEVDVAALARAAAMSRSAFFRHFRAVTAVSPIQYQKRLRLLEARRMMVDEAETAERSAFKVGYKSASQFSREYSRMFGAPPLRDMVKIRAVGSSVLQV